MAAIEDRRILITGPAGQLARPVATSLAAANEVWGIARFGDPSGRERLEEVGVITSVVDLGDPDWAGLPSEFDFVLHFAADIVGDDFDRALQINAEGTGLLMERFSSATAILSVSSTVVYDLDDRAEHRFAETDPLGDSKPLFGRTYPIGKIAQEAVARTQCRALDVPTVIARINLSYGANGGLPAYQLDAIRQGRPVTVADHDTFHNPIHEDDVVASIPALLEAATVPATITNWGSNDTVSMREYCAYLGQLEGQDFEFEAVPGFIRSRAIDTTRQHELLGPSAIPWREGMARLVEERPR